MEHVPLKTKVGRKNSELWAAYQEVLAELMAKEEVPSTEAVAQAKKLGEAIKVANSVDVDAIIANLEGLTKGIQDAKEVFTNLNTAIDSKKEELKEVHDLEAETNSLVAIVAAKDKLVAEKKALAEEILQQAKERAEEIEREAEEAANRLEEEIADKERESEKNRQRLQAEWDYAFERACQKRKDDFSDDLKKESKALEEREAVVAEREANAEKLNAAIKELEKTLEITKDSEQKKIQEAVNGAVAKAKEKAEDEKTMLTKSYEAKLVVANSRIEDQNGFIAELRQRLDKAEAMVMSANDKVTAIATGALKAGADAATITKISEIAAGSGQKK